MTKVKVIREFGKEIGKKEEFFGKWKNFFLKRSTPGPASALYAHAYWKLVMVLPFW